MHYTICCLTALLTFLHALQPYYTCMAANGYEADATTFVAEAIDPDGQSIKQTPISLHTIIDWVVRFTEDPIC